MRSLIGSEIGAWLKIGGFLVSKRNSFLLSCYHFFSTDLHLSAADGKSTCLLNHDLATGFLSCKPMANTPTGHTTGFKFITHRKWFYNILQRLVCGNATISTGPGKHSHHRIVINFKIKFEYKGILVSVLPSLITFSAFHKQKKITREWDKKKRESDTKPRIFLYHIPTIYR